MPKVKESSQRTGKRVIENPSDFGCQSARRRRTTTLGALAHFRHFRHLAVCQGTLED